MELAKRYSVMVWVFFVLACRGAAIDPTEQMPNCSKYRCERQVVSFAPVPGLEDAVLESVLRLSAAAGRFDLRVDPTGIPVRFQEHILSTDPTFVDEAGNLREVCAQTYAVKMAEGPWLTQEIAVDPTPGEGCPALLELSVLHEMIHALAPAAPHAPRGLFAVVIESDHIDEPALVQLCSEFDCQAFVPEP